MDINRYIDKKLAKAEDAEERIRMALQEIKELAGEEIKNGTNSTTSND